MNGAPAESLTIVNSSDILNRRFVGKNVCHTLTFGEDEYCLMNKPQCRASELFMESMGIYLERHQDKKFHDPLAACLMVHPEIGYWVKGKTYRENSMWGTRLDVDGDNILADINRTKFWETFTQWK